jgi:hypothetical protein
LLQIDCQNDYRVVCQCHVVPRLLVPVAVPASGSGVALGLYSIV